MELCAFKDHLATWNPCTKVVICIMCFHNAGVGKYLFNIAQSIMHERTNSLSFVGFSLSEIKKKNDLDVNNHIKRNSFV